MIHTSSDLIGFLFPVATVQKNADESVTVEGFASMSTFDIDGDLVTDPTEFQLAKFLEGDAPLLVNHKEDQRAGRVLEATPAELRDDGDSWGAYRLHDGEPLGSIDKAALPDVDMFTRGLWVRAQVSERMVAERVRNGGLRSFSWRGLVGVSQKLVDKASGFMGRLFREIELIEISLVDHPANRHAVVAVAKSATTDPSDVDALLVELQRLAGNIVSMLAELKASQAKQLADARRGYVELETGEDVAKDRNSVLDSVFNQSGETVVNHFQ